MDNFSKENYTKINLPVMSDSMKEELAKHWCIPVECIGELELEEPIIYCKVTEVDSPIIEPVYEINIIVPIKCGGYPPGKCKPTYTKHAIRLVVGLFSGMWRICEGGEIPMKRVYTDGYFLEEENSKLKETISDLQKTINLLVEERNIVIPRTKKVYYEVPREMPEWFKKGFEK